MSSMLEQAIIDAEELREAARKNAEETVVEKYQDEIREAVEKILEQDEVEEFGAMEDFGEIEGVEGGEDTALEVTDEGELTFVDDLPSAQMSDEKEIVTIDLDKLEEMMAEEMEEGTLDASDMADREGFADQIDALTEDDEEVELDEDVLNELLAEFGGDSAIFSTKGAAKRDPREKKEEEESSRPEAAKEPESEDPTEKEDLGFQKGRPYKRDLEEEELEEETDKRDDMGGGHGDYKTAKNRPNFPYQESLVKENKSLLQEQQQSTKKVQVLKEKLNKYGTIINKLKEKLNESNLTNAKLLYQNRVLNSISLNERQKDRIADAISSATSAEEAKIIFETLQSAVGITTKRSTSESLNEVVSRSSSAFISRREEKQKVDPFAERMKALAGLKNT